MVNNQSPTQEELTVWRIAGPDAVTLEAIVNGLALIWEKLPFRDEQVDPDILAAWFPETQELERSVRLLAEIIVGRATGHATSESRDAERPGAIQVIDSAVQQARLRLTKRRREDALGDAAMLIREIGFEYGDHECLLATDRDGADVIGIVRVERPTAYASLLDRLMQRADSYMATDAALSLERAASTWFFSRWSDGAWEGDPLDSEFPRSVREHEWSIVSRDTLALDEPVMLSLARKVEDDDGADELPPRQRFLANAYAMSTVGIFDVTSVDGRRMHVRDVRDDQTYVVHEHNEDVELTPNWLILGRLIPIDGGEWLRSPGTLVIQPNDEGHADALAEMLTTLTDELPTPIALEAVISMAVYGVDVPVDLMAAPTVNEARAALIGASELLSDLGLIGEVPESAAPPDLLAQLDSPAFGVFGLGIDRPVAEWLGALISQAGVDEPPAGRAARQRTRGKHRQKKRRKR